MRQTEFKVKQNPEKNEVVTISSVFWCLNFVWIEASHAIERNVVSSTQLTSMVQHAVNGLTLLPSPIYNRFYTDRE